MRVLFLGTPAFAVPSLERLVSAGHEVAAVYTQPDRPKGRGRELSAPAVKSAAGRLGIPVRQPDRIRQPHVVGELAALRPEVMVVVGYGQIIPQPIIDLPPRGILNVHASLLPKYRGAAPVQWAIAMGETVTGVTTMQIDAGLDTGPTLLQRQTPIGPQETAIDLSERLGEMGADLLVETLAGIEAGTVVPREQDDSAATHAPILKKEDGWVDWSLPATAIHNRVRGFVPWPGAHTRFRGRLLHIWKARPAEAVVRGPAGALRPERERMLVACGNNTTLLLEEVQVEGRKRIPARDFLHGQHVAENEILGDTN